MVTIQRCFIPAMNRKFADGYIKSLNYPFKCPPHQMQCIHRQQAIHQALISTSTPDGRSSFDNASTVLEEDV